MTKINQIKRKYLSQKDQIKIKILEDECLMLAKQIDRVTRRRDRLMRERDKVLDKGLES